MKPAAYWIERLGLQKHPEGGWFKETYRSKEIIEQAAFLEIYSGNRNVSTSIYYLLEGSDKSVFHRLKSDETWHFYTGTSNIKIIMISPAGKLSEHLIGANPDYNEVFQFIIPKVIGLLPNQPTKVAMPWLAALLPMVLILMILRWLNKKN